MTNGSFGTSAVIGVLFGSLAAACAFVIAYAEYARHFPGKARPVRMALQTALVALAFFLLASLLLPWLLVRVW
jgi:hypothetical protein